jgi:hypothetical protein
MLEAILFFRLLAVDRDPSGLSSSIILGARHATSEPKYLVYIASIIEITAHVRGALQAPRRVEAVFLISALHPIYMRQANAATKSPRAMKVYGRGSEISRCARFLVSVAEQI